MESGPRKEQFDRFIFRSVAKAINHRIPVAFVEVERTSSRYLRALDQPGSQVRMFSGEIPHASLRSDPAIGRAPGRRLTDHTRQARGHVDSSQRWSPCLLTRQEERLRRTLWLEEYVRKALIVRTFRVWAEVQRWRNT